MSRLNEPDVDYYNCIDKPDGHYMHPTDCTRYIECHNGRATDMACPDCDQNNNPHECAGSLYLNWDDTTKRCDWPLYTKCIPEPPDEFLVS